MNTKPDVFEKYISQFPAKSQPELKRRLKHKKALEEKGDLEVTSLVWESFLVTSDIAKDSKVKVLKTQAIEIRNSPKKFIKSEHFEAKTLCLLEILFDLSEGIVMFPYETYQEWSEVANEFGFWRLRYELEDAIFKHFDPENYELFKSVIGRKMKADEALLRDIRFLIEISATKQCIKSLKIYNRQKNIYGVYKKIQIKQKNINDIYDIYGFRLIVESQAECYALIDMIHRLWPHYPNRFKDYIKHPKPNGYQSLHTVVNCLQKSVIEFQIRTNEMDAVASSGMANHAAYKKNTGKK